MTKDEIVSAVRESAEIDTREHAERAVQATLTVLGQRLSSEAADLAAQLPAGLAECLTTDGEADRFGLEEFYQRVADEEGQGCSAQQARQHARATAGALREAVGAEYLHVLGQLPKDYTDLTLTDNVQHH